MSTEDNQRWKVSDFWTEPLNLHKITRKTWSSAAPHNHALFVLFFSLNLRSSQSGPPGQIMHAGSLITADTSLAEPGWNFSQTFGRHQAQSARGGTAPHRATPLRSKSTIIKY